MRHRQVGGWLLLCALSVFLIVIIGGITRLTESGLSITEWRPVSGVLPPLTDAQWQSEFAKYQQIPEYRQMNPTMSLDEFKRIFFWEYLHRLWGRLVGLLFVLPLAWFAFKRAIPPSLLPRLVGIAALIGVQGFLGWYMVQSGLSERTDVSQYRLAAHLSLALVIYGMMLWTGLSVLGMGLRDGEMGAHRSLRRLALATLLSVSLTVVAGAFVAGLNAGKAFNTFPLMLGRVVPPGYFTLSPWYRNFFENAAAVQFNHRYLALFTLFVALVAAYRGSRAHVVGVARRAFLLVAAAALLQVALGIVTLLRLSPVSLSALHQVGALLLLTAALVAVRTLARRAT